MNKVIENIMSRQTIREYTDQQVPDELLQVVLDAAIRAPSGRNSQPCHLRVLTNKERLEEMNKDFKDIVGWDTPAYTGWNLRPVYHNAPVFATIFHGMRKIVLDKRTNMVFNNPIRYANP
mgnify:CR=1 FL=1